MPTASPPCRTADLRVLALGTYDRRVLAACLAQRLAPAAWACAAFATSEVEVALPGHARLRPSVAIVTGALPVDPTVTRAPVLVIELLPARPADDWLALGVDAVWSLGADAAVVSEADGTVRHVLGPAVLERRIPSGASAAPLRLPWPPGKGRAGTSV